MHTSDLVTFDVRTETLADAVAVYSLAQAMAASEQEEFRRMSALGGRGSLVFSVQLTRRGADDFQDFLSSFGIVFDKHYLKAKTR